MTEVLQRTTVNVPADMLPPPLKGTSRPQGLTLNGYGGAIGNVKLLEPCYPDTPIDELKRRYEEDGVIWVSAIDQGALC